METDPSKVLALVVDHLSKQPSGVRFDELLTNLESQAAPTALADALNQAVDNGAVRYLYQAGPQSTRWERGPSNIVLYLATNIGLLSASPAEVNDVVSYFAQREDYERFGGGPWVMLEAAKVFEDFASKKQMPAAKLAGIFETLRSEGMLQFLARAENGYITVTLSAHRHYTVVAMQVENPAYHGGPCNYSVRYFHVRAGSPDVACRKVERVWVDDGRLVVQSVVEGSVKFEVPPGSVEGATLSIESL
jgi:hypothetical protein